MKKFLFCITLLPLMLLAQTENWVYRYNGPGSDWDEANTVVYGADGNIYAAGRSYSYGTLDNFTVISLTTAGDTNWVYRYNGPGNHNDWANSIVYGADNNIYAAGYSYGSGTSDDFIVISLTNTGDTNWVYRYNGPGNDVDCARSIVYGADVNIYAAGYSYGSGTSDDFIVISLTNAGDTNWVYRYNGPGNSADGASSLVYGADGNVYAAGSSYGSGTSWDFTVISLTPAGDTNWVYRYNGSGNDIDYANSIVYGADGNIYAAGRGYYYGTSDDFVVISLTTAGDTNWVYHGPGNSADYANSIVYGADDNIYAAGTSNFSATSGDFTVIRLTPAGDTNWVYRYNGPGNYFDVANSIVYGADGNIYAAGSSTDIDTDWDFIVISLTNAGDTNWIYRYDGSGNDWANSIVYGADGNVYAAGCSFGGYLTYEDFTVISLNPDLGVKKNNVIVRKKQFTSTIFAGPLRLPDNKNCKVFDITGRNIMPEKIKPGIYFIEVDGKITRKVVKVR